MRKGDLEGRLRYQLGASLFELGSSGFAFGFLPRRSYTETGCLSSYDPISRPNKAGKSMILHLLRCQEIAVANYSFNLGRLEATAPSNFAKSG
jgi:hypothetical protein